MNDFRLQGMHSIVKQLTDSQISCFYLMFYDEQFEVQFNTPRVLWYLSRVPANEEGKGMINLTASIFYSSETLMNP